MKVLAHDKGAVAAAVAAAREAAKAAGLKVGPAVSQAARQANGSLPLPPVPEEPLIEDPLVEEGSAVPPLVEGPIGELAPGESTIDIFA